MQPLAERDYFSDYSILRDPYQYFEAIRAKGPIYRLPGSGVVVVTGFDETLDVLKNTADFSSAIAPQGPAAPLPFEPRGPDITAEIEAHRTSFVGGDLVVAYDDQQHSLSRSIISRLFTPSRLKANEAFITELAEHFVRDAVARGGCELIREIATPFVTLVIADLLGVPAEDRQLFMDAIEAGVGAGSLNAEDLAQQNQPLVLMGTYFLGYVQDRRANPRDDVLSDMANATYPDGSTPELLEIVRLATFLFAAGQDTSAKLLGNAMRFVVEQPGLQDQLRQDPSLIQQLLEEVLRLEGSTKMTARLARRDTRIGDYEIPLGTKVMLALAGGNRDPRRWEDPEEFVLGRPRIKEHLAFGRGAHVCAGAPLARAEVRVILEKFLEHTSNIDLVEAKHGPRGDRTFDYEPSFIIRGLAEMHLELTPASGEAASGRSIADHEDATRSLGLFGLRKGSEAEPSSPTRYSVADTKIGVLLADAAARVVLAKHLPGVAADPRFAMATGMTLRAVQAFAPDHFTNAALDAVDSELARLPVR